MPQATFKGRVIQITDDKKEFQTLTSSGTLACLGFEIQLLKSQPQYKQFLEWLLEAKCILPTVQLIAVKALQGTTNG